MKTKLESQNMEAQNLLEVSRGVKERAANYAPSIKRELQKAIIDKLVDPAGYCYRFSLPSAPLMPKR